MATPLTVGCQAPLPKVQVSPQDLQYALTGNNDSIDLTGEKILTPTYAVIRICKLGKNSKQLCTYLPVNKLSFSNKPFKWFYKY